MAKGEGRPMERTGKLGILTYHTSVNEGAILQAYALQRACSETLPGLDVELVAYESRSARRRDLASLIRRPRTPAALAHRARRVRRLRRFCREALRTGPRTFVSDDYPSAVRFINAQGYSAIVVGSDEVWKLASTNPRPFPNPYWLGEGIQARRFSYAASANKTSLAEIPAAQRDFIARALEGYEILGVRDSHTERFARELTDPERVVRVPDPTFLLPSFEARDVEEKLARRGFDPARPAVVVNLPPGEFAGAVADHFRSRGWQVVAVTEYQPEADLNLVGDLDPLEWIAAIARCRLSVTHRFHGTIFSIFNRVPFLAVQSVSDGGVQNRKVADLLDGLDMRDNLFVHRKGRLSRPELAEALDRAVEGTDFSGVDGRIQAVRADGLSLLRRIGERV